MALSILAPLPPNRSLTPSQNGYRTISLKDWNLTVPTAWGNYIWQDRMYGNVYASLLVCFYFLHHIRWFIIIKINITIWGARDKLLSIHAETALDGKPWYRMTFISLVLIKLERRACGEYCNVISVWLGNKNWVKWVAPQTGTSIGFYIDLI